MKTEELKLSTDTFAKPKLQPLNLLKGIANIIKDATTGGWAGLPSSIIDTISAIKLDDNPSMVGWRLVSRSLVDSLFTLISESNVFFLKEDIETEPLDKTLNTFLENKDYYLKADFFKYPKSFKLLNDIKPTLHEYLKLFNFTDIEILNILERLNSYFVHSLINEWRRNVNYYSILKDIVETPFNEVEKKETEWKIYSNYLETQIQKPVFSETFSLEQIYIPLRAYYKIKKENKSKLEFEENPIIDHSESKRIVVDIDSYLIEWINKEDKNDSIRLLRGGPGYGKSSFLKIFAAKLAAMGKRVLFIPLHRFDIEDKLDQGIRNFLRYDKYFTYDLINDDDEKLIILFDGLDELSMQGKVLTDIAQSFLREVERSTTNFNDRKLKIQSIISGRDVIVQQNESDFRNDGQILRLLPYYLTDEEKKDLIDKNNLLKIDQRNEWWKKYGKVIGKNYKSLPKELKTTEIDEITAQPLLNFLVALSYERKKIDFTKKPNLNEIYCDLLNAVYDRSYSDGKKLKSICSMEHEHFSIILEEIALSAWHGKGRTTTVADIKQHFQNSGLTELLSHFISDAEKGVVSLLAAFYFRQAGQTIDGLQTFEFTHKSFGEYLTAKKIVHQLQIINDQLKEYEKDIFKRKGWSTENCLIEWIRIFGSKVPDYDLIRFISNELMLIEKKQPSSLKVLQETIIKLFTYVLYNGMPLEKLFPRLDTFKEENDFAINSEKAILVMHSLIADITNEVSNIKWPSNTSFGEFLSRQTGQRTGPNIYILGFCNHLNLRSSVLYLKDLYRSNFKSSQLDNAELYLAILEEVNFQGANLIGADLHNVNLKDANLSKTNLKGADLNEANLKGANLQGANLQGANLHLANLQGADLQGADLQGVEMDNDDFDKLRMQHRIHHKSKDFLNTNLKGANLRGANLKGVNLDGVNLDGVILDEEKTDLAKTVKITIKNKKNKSDNMVVE